MISQLWTFKTYEHRHFPEVLVTLRFYCPTRNVLQDLSRSCKTYPDKHSKISYKYSCKILKDSCKNLITYKILQELARTT